MLQFVQRKADVFCRLIPQNLNFYRTWKNGLCTGTSILTKPRESRSSKSRYVPVAVSQRIRQDVFVNVNFRNRIAIARKTWSSMSPTSASIFEAMKSGPGPSVGCKVTLSDCTVEELLSFVADIVNLPESKFEYKLRNDLETECIRRISDFDQKAMLYVADVFFVMNMTSNKYLKAVFQEFERRWNTLSITKEDVLQLLFFLSILRTSSIFLMHKVEEFISEHASQFSINEVGLVCHTFFVTNTAFRNFRTLENVSDLVLNNVDKETFHVGLLVNIMKSMRHAQFPSVRFYKELGAVLCQKRKLQDATLSDLATLSFTYSSLKMVHRDLTNYVSALTKTKISGRKLNYVRMKDLSRLLWSSMMMCADIPRDVLEKLLHIMRLDSQLPFRYPEAFVEGLVALAVNRIYPADLLDVVFSPKYLAFKSGRLLEQHFQLLLLSSMVQIDCENYKGNRLSQTYLASCPSELFGNLGYELRTRQGLLSLIQTLHHILGDSSFLSCHFILSHSRITDVELRLDSSNHPVMFNSTCNDPDVQHILCSGFPKDLSNNLTLSSQETSISHLLLKENQETSRTDLENIYLKANKPGSQRRISIKVMGWNQYALNEPLLLGLHQMELRLLARLGYDVFAVNPVIAQQLDNSSLEGKEKIVRSILEKCDIHLE